MGDANYLLWLTMVDGLLLLVRLWALVRALTRPASAFDGAGKSKFFWVAVLAVCLFLPFIGFAVALGYLFSTDRKVSNAQRLGPRIGFPGST